MVVIFLYTIAHNHKNRVLQKRFGRSGETISRHIHRVLRAILRLAPILLCKPQPVPENCDDFRWKHFKGCLGAIDGTYIKQLSMTREQEQSIMAESSVGGAKKRNKNLTWTPAMDDCLIDIMLEMVKNNQYQNGTFRPRTYKEMERQLNLLEPKCGVRVDPNIQSRLKTLKKKFNGVKELRSLSGAG
ncbi:hypothetical protein LINGRAHAP2_LOCUS24297 [Linum grandiflorum]